MDDIRNRQFSSDALTFDDMNAGSENAFRPDLEAISSERQGQEQNTPPDKGDKNHDGEAARSGSHGGKDKRGDRGSGKVGDDTGENTGDDTGDDDEHDTPEIQELAKEMGWKPEGGKNGRNVSAREFIRTGHQIQKSLRDSLHNTRKDIRRLSRQVGEITAGTAQIKTAEIDTKIAALEEEFDAAVEDSDKPKAREIRKQIHELEASKPKATKGGSDTQPELEPDDEEAISGWVKDHDWWNKDADRTEIAGTILDKIRTQHPDFTVTEALEELDARLDKLGLNGKRETRGGDDDDETGQNTGRNRPASRVGGGSMRGGSNTQRSAVTMNDLSQFQQETVRYNVRYGLYATEKDAIAAMVKEGSVKPRR